jgi:lysyl-tRNA synthetase class 2
MDDCSHLLAACASAVGTGRLKRGDRRCDPFARPTRLTVPDAFAQYCDIDLLATTPDPDNPARDLLAAEARRIGSFVSDNDSWEDIFFRLMMERVEPHLGDGVPLILCDYPASMAALSRRSPADPRVAERFELYACGVELANGFSELTDAAEQRRRFTADMALKKQLYGVTYPIDEDFLAALDHGMPDCAGIALGVDRLVMLLTGAENLEQALWAPVHQPG